MVLMCNSVHNLHDLECRIDLTVLTILTMASKKLNVKQSECTLTPIKPGNRDDRDIDWEKCILCQKKSSDALVCPFNNTQKNVDKFVGYETITQEMERFWKSGLCPFKLHDCLTGDSEIVVKLLSDQNAKWHKLCRNKICFYKYERAIKRKSSTDNSITSEETPKKITRLNSGDAAAQVVDKCFFCNSEKGHMRKVSTFEIDQKIRKCALEINDTVLLAKLSSGDLISQEAQYHLDCLSALYYKASVLNKVSTSADTDQSQAHGIALGEIISYIDEAHHQTDSNVFPIHKLSDIVTLYNTKVNSIYKDVKCKVNSTHLKERILSQIPNLEAHRQGRDVLLVHKDNIGDMIKTASESSYDDEGVLLTKAAKFVHGDILTNATEPFQGTFNRSTTTDSIPQSLAFLVQMILAGPSIACQADDQMQFSQKVLNVSQLIVYNVSEGKHALKCKSKHLKRRETPLAVYLGMLIHAETRKRSIIDKFHALGICISYHRLLEISTNIGNYVSDCYNSEGIVCPLTLKTGIFTTSAVDNIDHNPSSVTAKGSFHGTGISIFQHKEYTKPGGERPHPSWSESHTSAKFKIADLPDDYSRVPPVSGKLQDNSPNSCKPERINSNITQARDLEKRWLEHVYSSLEEDVTEDTSLSWPAFHAQQLADFEPLSTTDTDISALLPLFPDQAKSAAMIRHSMNIVKKTVNYLNPGQIPVMAADQPLYALAKQIQWTWPNAFGEDKFIVMFGGLHIELAALKTVGDLLQDSGWSSAMTQANIATPGSADSFVKATNILRTRHAHQITAATLYILMKQQYGEYVESTGEQIGPEMSLERWCETRQNESPMFMFWALVLNLEITILIFIRSLRQGNFQLYVNSLLTLVPWFFALDHSNYARWIPVHIKDMLSLARNAPDVALEFEKGHFCLQKTLNRFSAIPLDQAHEQNNKLIKDDGGAVGLTENPSQLLRWMICGPEIARMITEFEDVSIASTSENKKKHHEQTKSIQLTFQKQVNDLKSVIQDMGNPFAEKSEDLLVLDTRDIVDSSVAESIKSITELGKRQYDTFVHDRLTTHTKSLMDTVKQNKLPLFSRPPVRKLSKQKLAVSSLKENCALFSQLYVSCQVRKGNLDEFFSHENSSYPPSLSQFGDLRSGKKSDLMPCLEKYCNEPAHDKPNVEALLVDGAAIINMLKPLKCKTFDDYAEEVFLPYILSQLVHVQRVDVVWDRYITNSLKAGTRRKRGTGVRRRVSPNTTIPSNWEAFLRNDDNKSELFQFLATKCSSMSVPEGKYVISTKDVDVVGTATISNVASIAPCSQEEADTRLLLHAVHVGKSNLTKASIKTVDTDVVVLAIALFQHCGLEELWIEFGSGKTLRYLPIHCLAKRLGEDIAKALPAFHAFTGCDQVSAFAGKGKRTAWNTLASIPEALQGFGKLSSMPSEEDIETCIPVLERFVVLMYDRASECETTNEARQELFTCKSRSIDCIPPTSAALFQHTRRVVYQAGYCWGQALTPLPTLPSPAEFGWTKEADPHSPWQPLWSTLMPASKSCQELLKCGCDKEKGCRGRCKCVHANLPCTALCKCNGLCDRL